jgi:hypothetical protein
MPAIMRLPGSNSPSLTRHRRVGAKRGKDGAEMISAGRFNLERFVTA